MSSWRMFEGFSWVADQRMPGALKWTLQVLVHEAVHERDGSVVARITQEDLGRLTCASRKTMWAHLAELESRQLVEKIGVAGSHGGLEYRLLVNSLLRKKVTGENVTGATQEGYRSGADGYIDRARPDPDLSLTPKTPLLFPTLSAEEGKGSGEGEEKFHAPSGARARLQNLSTGGRNRTKLPDDFVPDEKAQALAKALKFNPFLLAAEFRDHHTANGTLFLDWQAAFRSWIRKEVKLHTAGRVR